MRVAAHVLDPTEIPGNPHADDCVGTLCPDCGCCMHCLPDGCGCPGCGDDVCYCPTYSTPARVQP